MPSDTSTPIILLRRKSADYATARVQFILKRDYKDRSFLRPCKSEFSGGLCLRKYGLNAESLESVYLVLDAGQPSEHNTSKIERRN